MDSLVTDLVFQANATLDQASLLAGLGGEAQLATWNILDPDMLDPRAEMEISPSRPFRGRNERRLLLIDKAGVPLRAGEPLPTVPVTQDLTAAKATLIAICEALPIRMGRLFALGSWGDAVIITRQLRDLRALALMSWVLDPQVDVDGKKRGSRLTPKEYEAKVMAYDKRLDELDDQAVAQLLKSSPGAHVEQRGELWIVDVLQADGSWLPADSLQLEETLAAWAHFSLIPGAPARLPGLAPERPAVAPSAPPPTPPQVAKGPPLGVIEKNNKVVLLFPATRFDLDIAALLGKQAWDSIVRPTDGLSGQQRDRLHRDGGAFVAPLEFLSEVFVDGKPLSRPTFDAQATAHADGARALEVHFPRFGPVWLVDLPGQGRFVSSLASASDATEASRAAAALGA